MTLYDSYGDGWIDFDGSYSSITIDGVEYVLTTPYPNGLVESFTICIDLSVCTDVIFAASNYYSSECSWDIVDAAGNLLASGGPASGQVGTCAVSGCTDPTATNYDPTATVDDGSCTYPCLLDEVTLVLYDSYGDGWNGGSLTIDGVSYTQDDANYSWPYTPGASESFLVCIDLSVCTDVIYAAGSFSSENSWEIYDAAGNLLASGPNASGQVGTCAVYGCTDPAADNYDPAATADDGSCTYTILGCTDPLACNYDANANTDDGSCTYPAMYYDCNGVCINDADGDGICDELEIPGCTDATACNYDPAATDNDGSCILPDGCTDPTASNYDANAVCDDGSCIACVYGCTDNTQSNYDANATCDDGSCVPFTYGCMDPTAINYNPTVTADDGSCLYLPGCMDMTACNYNPSADIDEGSCILPDGCTDPNAANYDPAATCDDGSCIGCVYGCTDPVASNYDPLATCEDGSCWYSLGCTDPTAINYDPSAVIDDGSCVWCVD